jgi:uncharacterized protein (DUF1800 family)
MPREARAKGREMTPKRTRGSAIATGTAVVAVAWSLLLGTAAEAAPLPPTEADAIRFLEQATWGPTESAISAVKLVGVERYLDKLMAIPPIKYTAFDPWPPNRPATCVDDRTLPVTPTSYCARDNYTLFQLQREFFENAVMAPDQLRQRVAFALSQIFVTSGTDISQAYAMQRYQQMLSDLAFGNFRDVLTRVTLSPAMGNYLDMVNNRKPNAATGVEPNENYAREVLQLFSIGTVELDLDGTPLLDAGGSRIPTYGQEEIEGFAHVFTGWTYPTAPGVAPQTGFNPRYYDGQMEERSQYHAYTAKTLLDEATAPANLTMSADLANAINSMFVHPNVGPFISKQLIQKLVTGNPSPQYVRRVATVFNNNGAGTRGDLRAVVRAILLDPEARGAVKTDPSYGRLREPAQYVVALARALNATTDGVFLRAQSAAMAQPVFQAPSVFNFYPPSYMVPQTDVLGPEFAIHNTTTSLARINFVNSLVYGTINPDQTVYGAIGTQIDWSPLAALAADPDALVDKVDRILMHGTLSAEAHAAIVTAVKAISVNDKTGRAKAAFYLVATSPQYQVER